MKIGEFKGFPVYKVKNSFETMEVPPNAIYVLPSGSMYLNGEVVGVLDMRVNKVVSWWPERITKVKEEEREKKETESKVMVSVEKRAEDDEYHTFDLDGFLKEMEQRLEGERG